MTGDKDVTYSDMGEPVTGIIGSLSLMIIGSLSLSLSLMITITIHVHFVFGTIHMQADESVSVSLLWDKRMMMRYPSNPGMDRCNFRVKHDTDFYFN